MVDVTGRPATSSSQYMEDEGISLGSDPSYAVDFSNQHSLQAEVDRILDKINENGFGSLTQDEKNTLDKAKGLLNRH